MLLDEKDVIESIRQAEITLNMVTLLEEIKKIQQVTACEKCDGSCTGKSDDDCNY